MLRLSSLGERKLLMISGKGGTGKTLLTAALALKFAALGKQVLVVESALTEQLPPLFGRASVGHHETLVAPRIHAINLNPRLCFKEYVVEHLGLGQLYKRVFDHRVVKSFLDAIPGLAETMLLGRLFHTGALQEPQRYDLILFDAPALGHFYNLLTTPDAIIGSGLGGPLVKEVKRVHAFLADPQQCGGLLVTLPEELVSTETIEFLPKLVATTPLTMLGVGINRCPSAAEAIGGEGIEPGLLPAVATVLAYEQKQDAQRRGQCAVMAAELNRLSLGVASFELPELGEVAEPLSLAKADEFLQALPA